MLGIESTIFKKIWMVLVSKSTEIACNPENKTGYNIQLFPLFKANLDRIIMKYLINRKHVPCFYRVLV